LADERYPVEANQEEGIGANPADAQDFVELLKVVRSAIPSPKVVSISVPCRESDMMAYTSTTVPALDASVDWWNLMTYDYVNRYDSATGYHAGKVVVDAAVASYTLRGLDPKKMVIGFPMYAKWFTLDTPCAPPYLGCPMGPFEQNGVILKPSGTYVPSTVNGINWVADPNVAANVAASYASLPTSDNSTADASAWYDNTYKLFWTWVSPSDIGNTCSAYKSQVGGVSVWSLNQDNGNSAGGTHIAALSACVGA
jgi:chitinase